MKEKFIKAVVYYANIEGELHLLCCEKFNQFTILQCDYRRLEVISKTIIEKVEFNEVDACAISYSSESGNLDFRKLGGIKEWYWKSINDFLNNHATMEACCMLRSLIGFPDKREDYLKVERTLSDLRYVELKEEFKSLLIKYASRFEKR